MPTFTPTPRPTLTPTPDARCNHLAFVTDVTVPDNTIVQLSEPFTKTWRVRNDGTCTWGSGYRLVFAGGDQLNGPASITLPADVAPRQTVDIAVSLTAPSEAGRYEGRWQMQSPDGRPFGGLDPALQELWVRIRAAAPPYSSPTLQAGVTQPTASGTPTAPPSPTAVPSATPTSASPTAPQVIYDFALKPCEAQWQSAAGVLSCPGSEGAASGFVLPLAQAPLEDGTTAELPSLLTFPQNAPDGYILGMFPEYEVQPGDHFQAAAGCEKDATSCSVLFRLSYLDSASAAHDLWTLGEFYDGKYFNLDLDLTRLAGQKVRFVLYVSTLGSATGDRALWVDPRIMRFPAPTAPATDTATVVPPAASPTLVPSRTPRPAATVAAVPTAAPAPTAPSVQQIFENILNFFQNLFGGH